VGEPVGEELRALGPPATLERTKAPQVVSVAVRPARSKSKKKGNAILELSLNTKPEFRAIGLSKEGKQLVAKDDGVYPDRRAGDGVFAVLTTLKEAPTKTTRGSFTSGKGEVITHGFKVKFDLRRMPAGLHITAQRLLLVLPEGYGGRSRKLALVLQRIHLPAIIHLIMPGRRTDSRRELLQPPVLYLLGVASLVLTYPLEAFLGEAVARTLAVLAFNAVLYAVLRRPMALAAAPGAILIGAALGILTALPSISTTTASIPAVLPLVVITIDAAWEELLFRGLAFDFTLRKYGTWGALALSSILFACVHLLDAQAAEPAVFLYLVLGGFAFGAMRLSTGSLWPGIALHITHNLVLSCWPLNDSQWPSLIAVAVVTAVLLFRVRSLERLPGPAEAPRPG